MWSGLSDVGFGSSHAVLRASKMALQVKNPPSLQEVWVLWGFYACSLGQEHSPGEGYGTHSDTLAWKIPWTDEPGGLQSMGSQRVGHD